MRDRQGSHHLSGAGDLPLIRRGRIAALGVLSLAALACGGPPDDGAPHDEIVGVTHRFAEVGPTRWHYLEAGRGAPVVFLHGLPESAYAWRRQFNWLSVNHRVIAVDLEGFGWSRTESEDASIMAMAERLIALLDALELESFHLVGHGWGGLIGARAAGMLGDRLLSYVHVSAPLVRHDLSRIPDFRDFRQDPDSIPDLLRDPEIFVTRTYELGVLGGIEAVPGALVERYTQALKNRHSQAALARYFSQVDVGPDWRLGPEAAPDWSAITAPVLFIIGGRDLLLPLEEYHDVETVVPTLVRLAVIEGTGHYPHEESPGDFGEVLYEFLEGR